MAAALWTHDRIQTLRVKAREGDKPALRLALMQALASLDLHPAGMSPSAVFMIRYLDDPLPGRLANKKKNNSAWRSALRDNLEELYRQAAKPVRCMLGGNPPAVVFGDHAELLACLLADICAQRVGHNWWWRSREFSSPHISQRIREVLMNEVRYLPAVFSHLANAAKALEVVKQIEPAHASDILQVMLVEFSLAGVLSSLLMEESELNQYESRTVDTFAETNKFVSDQQQPVYLHAVPPWAELFGEEIWRADLQREQAALLGVARTLHQRPAMMRNRIFQRSFAEWWANSTLSRSDLRAGKDVRVQSPVKSKFSDSNFQKTSADRKVVVLDPDDNQTSQTRNAESLVSDTQTDMDSLASREQVSADTGIFDDDGLTRKTPTKYPENFSTKTSLNKKDKMSELQTKEASVESHENPGMHDREELVTQSHFTVDEQEHFSERVGDSPYSEPEAGATEKNQSVAQTSTHADKTTLPEEHLDNDNEVNLHFSDTWIDTQLGGIAFLINLLKQLGLPQDFDERWKLEQQLGPWALVDLFARALLGTQFSPLYTDPVWRILARLDGRRTKLQIANKFSGQAHYHIPLAWYEWLQVEQLYWAASRNKLRIWTDSCVLVETTWSGDAYKSCVSELQRYAPDFPQTCLQQAPYRSAPIEVRSHLQACGINSDLARLLALVTPFVYTFLKRQLQMHTASKREVVRELLQLDSRIYLSSSHIDLVANIEHTRFNLRCAGLDQDPGWLPDYGRVVLIHFS